MDQAGGRQGSQQRPGHRHDRHPGHPGAVLAARVAQRHEQRPEDRAEEVPPVIGEDAHDDQEAQDDPEDDESARLELVPPDREHAGDLAAHDSSFIPVGAGD
jgi:hypothetical protein